jgi:methionine-S-sulfoxide reductase
MAVLTTYLACGCFWGAQYYFSHFDGVISTRVGYMGGWLDNPTYPQVKKGDTGHLETTEVVYDADLVTYEALIRFFFEIHDFEQDDGQGPDIGSQYLSAVFTSSKEEQVTVEKLISLLKTKGYRVATQIRPTATFWPAEDYHQDYYDNKESQPYCHAYHNIF